MYASMNNVDVALLQSEFAARDQHGIPCCPSCSAQAPIINENVHEPDCPHDIALSERGYPTQTDRDTARARIASAHAVTIPPAPSKESP